jgi:cysteinyl-tRNA synthetase
LAKHDTTTPHVFPSKLQSKASIMALHVHNTLTKKKEPFVPAQPKVVRIYTCGLTVYSHMHIGHARTYCFWDLFRRYLEYRGYHVVSVINYTDIDDRIIQRGGGGGAEGAMDLAERFIATFRRDCRALRIKDYSAYTRATDFVDEQVQMIRGLIEKKHAYVVEGEVFYDVNTNENYGELSGRKIEEQEVGASGRIEEDVNRKRNPADFTLWKPTETNEPSWATGETDWPKGRPGWHIECSAMSTSLLGNHFDVHGGGIDNMFPHHENEIAQSEPLCGRPWVRYWLHPNHLVIMKKDLGDAQRAAAQGSSEEEEKMSKSLGNVIGIADLLAKHTHDEVRWFYSTQHYRAKLPFNWELLAQASQGYARVKKLVNVLTEKLRGKGEVSLPRSVYASQRGSDEQTPRMRHHYVSGQFGAISTTFVNRFIDAMDDDLNTPNAAAALFDYVSALYSNGIEQSEDLASLLAVYRTLVRHLLIFGVEIADPTLYPELIADYAVAPSEEAKGRGGDGVLDKLLAMRLDARKQKDFAKADAIRNLLKEAGVIIEDTAQGSRWTTSG